MDLQCTPSAGWREEVWFTSGGSTCAAWWYPACDPDSDGSQTSSSDARLAGQTAPCVVMAHGFSMTRGDGLAPYAEAFAAAGAHVLVFDHRHLGDSGGEPRQRFRAAEQREDWRNAVAFAKARPDVDARRIILWGFSFSGGHVTSLLADGIDVSAAMLLCPFVDGLARVRATPLSLVGWILPRALADFAGRHTTIPVTGRPGERAAMNLPGESEGFAASRSPESKWCNEISPALFLTVAFFRPFRRARRITVPLWVGRCVADVSADNRAIGMLADRAPYGELHQLPGDHFAPFHGLGAAAATAEQVKFLHRVASPA